MDTISIEERKDESRVYRFSIVLEEQEIARARLLVAQNDLHQKPFGFLEDVHVLDTFQGKGFGTKIVKAVIAKAQDLGCYKLIATSRFERSGVHSWYEKLGFVHSSKAFRMNL